MLSLHARTALFAAAIAAVSIVAPSSRAQQAVTLHGAVQFNDEHAFNKALLKFEELVKSYYGKPINFVLHRNSELGLEKDYFAYMNQGISVDYGIVSPAHMSTFSKAAPFIDAPFLFRDLDHWNKVLDADLLKPIADEMLIGYAGGGVRNIFVNKPVRNLAEMKGLKVRVQGAPIWSRTFSAIGMSPTVIAYNEIYNAIQNGVIAAGEQGRRRRADEILRGRSQSLDDRARDHHPADLLLRQDLQEASARAASRGHQGRQGSRRLRPADRVLGGQRQARRLGKGRQAQAHRLHRSRGDEEAGRSSDGGLRQGDRRGRDLRADQRHQIARPFHDAVPRADRALHRRRPPAHEKADRRLLPTLTWLMVATVAILVVPVSLQIVSRYAQLIPSYIWTEELSRFLFIWMVMLGAMVGIKEGTHFEVDIWPELGRRANAMLKIVSNLFVLIFALVYLYWGIKFVEFGWHPESELAELPMPFIFVAWPLAGATWIIFLGEAFVDNIRIVAGRPPHDAGRDVARSGRAGAVRRVLRADRAAGAGGVALGLACLPPLCPSSGCSPMVLFNETFKSYNSFILLAVPFFL